MRKEGILNTDICYAISSLGHTDYLVIADPGLPIPENVTVIDISLVKGIPGFTEVFDAVTDELVIDSYIYAEEMETASTGCPVCRDRSCLMKNSSTYFQKRR